MARKQIGLALDPELLGRVDAARGMVPRAAWIAGALESALGPAVKLPETEINARLASAVEEASGNRGGPSAGNGDEANVASGRAPASPRRPPSIAETWAR